jgi:signal transduction histidine kinase
MNVSESELLGKTDRDFFPKNLADTFASADAQVLHTGEDWEGEEEIIFPGDNKKIVWCNKTPIKDVKTSRIVGVVGIFADVTKNHQRHAQEITQRTNDLVHEILIPMQSISSNIENLISAENGEFEMDKKERLSALSIALSELHILGMHAENMQRTLVGDESQQLVFRGCSIRSILRDCIGALTPAARLKNVDFSQIKLKSMKEFPKTEVFRPDLTRAFKNLYHNAVKYSYSGLGLSSSSTYQKRWISTEIGPIDNGSFYVEIQNYGVGIAPDEIEGIFEPGTRGRYSIDRHRTGSGIGLSQVRRIVLRHNGAVSITSEKRGGPWVTTVRVILPYQQPKEAIRYDDNVEDALG